MFTSLLSNNVAHECIKSYGRSWRFARPDRFSTGRSTRRTKLLCRRKPPSVSGKIRSVSTSRPSARSFSRWASKTTNVPATRSYLAASASSLPNSRKLHQRPAHLPGVVLRLTRVDVGEDEVLPVTATADNDLPVRVHDVTVAVAHAVGTRDGQGPCPGTTLLPQHEVHAGFPPPAPRDRRGPAESGRSTLPC